MIPWILIFITIIPVVKNDSRNGRIKKGVDAIA